MDENAENAAPRTNPIVDEFLRDSNILNLSKVDLSNSNNLFAVINSIKEVELVDEKEEFYLEHCKLGHKNIELLYDAISNNVTLSFQLHLAWNKLGEKGMVPIRKLFTPTIDMTHLVLDGNDIGDMGMRSLMRAMEVGAARITHLSLAMNGISKEGMDCLADKFPVALSCVSHINLSKNDLSNAEVAERVTLVLGKSKALRDINMASMRLGVAGCKAVARNLITKNRHLSKLDLTHNNARDEGTKEICTALRINSVLSRLDLGSNNVGPAGCACFVEAMSENETLRELDLSRTHSAQMPLGIEGARQIAHMLSVNQSITSLNLYWCQIESAGALLLASALEDNKTIVHLNLGGNYIGPAAVRRLEECMSPMYQPKYEEDGLSAWDSRANCTPLLLNRKTRIASRRPQSAAAVLSRLGPPVTSKNKKRETAINVNSRKSVLLSKPIIARPQSGKTSKLNIKELFAITVPTNSTKENRATLPHIKRSLSAIDSILVKGKHGVKPDKVFRQLKDNWVGAELTTSSPKRATRVDKLFHV
mmetsp:Transcript_9413/g.17612  ORF Transcript_9413/g.17612 Transcript_9413/m.17612 type:complete len:535 (+) Transcript_9413:163-1767(+)